MKKCSGSPRAMMLERIKGWPAFLIKRHDLAVEDRLVWH
jgi:hypothetical protein